MTKPPRKHEHMQSRCTLIHSHQCFALASKTRFDKLIKSFGCFIAYRGFLNILSNSLPPRCLSSLPDSAACDQVSRVLMYCVWLRLLSLHLPPVTVAFLRCLVLI